ncbi:hypothetical protein [uncultured Mucilaginibacter sp.]|uniref:hypothetical protein n=1 Tax=uncultured Mucilaginibacter sp. TaxID=797541 RepID=UPI0025F8ED42|nr:hypothetical protein [uncultured Mucilaginibacter sp.]
MIKHIRAGFTFLFTTVALGAMAQSTATTSSPYSQFGLGDINTGLLPQTRAMGGISTAINKINGYNTINLQNPASYGSINLTTIDIGVLGSFSTLKQNDVSSQRNGNFRLSHFNFAAPVSKRSALSFGLVPYSELGYNYRQSIPNFGTGSPADTSAVNYIYSGDGGLSKAYAGYGFGIGRHISFGGNVSYIFGNLRKFRSTEIPSIGNNLNSRSERSNSIGGVNFDYGTQVNFDFGDEREQHLVFGYSGSASSTLNSKVTNIVSQYKTSAEGDESAALDTLSNQVLNDGKIKLPLMHHFGISFQKDGKFLIGADYSIGNWSKLSIPNSSEVLRNSQTLNVGGQFTPNGNALHNYFALIDYRLGFRYDKTYINVANTNINQYAGTFGLGLPLAPNGGTFYKINIAAEYGQRGTLTNNLIKENFFNIHIGFTLNDIWFRKYKFD